MFQYSDVVVQSSKESPACLLETGLSSLDFCRLVVCPLFFDCDKKWVKVCTDDLQEYIVFMFKIYYI